MAGGEGSGDIRKALVSAVDSLRSRLIGEQKSAGDAFRRLQKNRQENESLHLVHTFGEQSTVQFKSLPPGTVFRERYVNNAQPDTELYTFWVVGSPDRDGSNIRLYEAYYDGNTHDLPELDQHAKLRVIPREFPLTGGRADYLVGSPGTILDSALRGSAVMQQEAQLRHTTWVDIVQYGPKDGGGHGRPRHLTKLEFATESIGVRTDE